MPVVRVTLDLDIPDESSFRAALHFDRRLGDLDLLGCARLYLDMVVVGVLEDDLADAGANVVGSDAAYVK